MLNLLHRQVKMTVSWPQLFCRQSLQTPQPFKKRNEQYSKGQRKSILQNSHMKCYRALNRRKQSGIEKKIMLHVLQNSDSSKSRLFAWGLIKRSLISKARYRYCTGVLNPILTWWNTLAWWNLIKVLQVSTLHSLNLWHLLTNDTYFTALEAIFYARALLLSKILVGMISFTLKQFGTYIGSFLKLLWYTTRCGSIHNLRLECCIKHMCNLS